MLTTVLTAVQAMGIEVTIHAAPCLGLIVVHRHTLLDNPLGAAGPLCNASCGKAERLQL